MYYNNNAMMLINCSGCQTPLQLPHGAKSIRCALCQAITQIADPRAVAAPPAASHAPPPPSPFNHAPPGPPPSPHGRKKAVIVGISYKFSRHELKGCINDAKCMKYLLINKFSFPEASIIMLTGITTFRSSYLVYVCVYIYRLVVILVLWNLRLCFNYDDNSIK